MEASQLQQLQAALDQYPELRSLIRLPEQRALNRLLRRAALPRSFDQQMFTDLLAADLGKEEAISFEKFVASTEVERVPYTEDRFALRDSARSTYLTEWKTAEPGGVRAWAERLVAHYGDGGNRLDILDALLRSDQDRARQEFVRLYREADAKLDLARCYALLEILQAHTIDLDDETHALLLDYSSLYGARALYAEEFHQTVDYFERPAAQRRFRRLLGRHYQKWIFHVHGPGGMGKTMLLRWMVSHRLITRRMRIPCVWLDFDSLSVSAVANQPWLLALPIAEQLDHQVQVTGTSRIIASLQWYRRLLRKVDEHISAESDEALRGLAEHESVTDLRAALSALPATRPIVFILDTIEEASTHQPDGLIRIIDFFAALHRSVPQIRLVLAGRYALGLEQVPQYRTRFAKQTVYQRFRRLSAKETCTFFTQLLPSAGNSIAEAVVSRGDGNPFKIALLAEMIEADSSITRERLLSSEFDKVDVAYLLKRVIGRIPAAEELPIRWVLRYGVVPRRLTKDFVSAVLVGPLQRALSGSAQEAGDDMVGEAISSGLWIPRPDVTVAVDDLWKQLTNYSSGHGWISVDKLDANAATLHADILNPMRRMLREQIIFGKIQASAVAYFEQIGSLVDVLFHKIYLGDEETAGTWTAVFNRPELRDDAAGRRRLAELLLKRDFGDAPPTAKLVARLEAIEAIAMENGYVFFVPDIEYDSLLNHWRAAEALHPSAAGGATRFPESIGVCLEAVARFRSGSRDDAKRGLEQYWGRTTLPGDRARAAMHIAEMASRTSDPDSELWLKRVLEDDAGQEAGVAPPRIVHERLADLYSATRRWDKARLEMQRATDRAQQDGIEREITRLGRRLIEWDILTNEWQAGYERLEMLDPRRDRAAYADLRAQLATATLRPDEAMRFANAAISGSQRLEASRMLLTLGDALQQLLRLSEAVGAYQRSASLCEELGDIGGIDAACTRELMLHVRTTGNLMAAGQILSSQVLHTPDPIRHAAWDMARAWRALETGSRPAAQQMLALGSDASPENAYRLVSRLSLGVDETLGGDTMERLLASIDCIHPMAARLSLLGDLAVTAAWPAIEPEPTGGLLSRFLFNPKGPVEAPAQALLGAELLRAVRRYDDAVRLLDSHAPTSIDLAKSSDAGQQPLFWCRLRLERAIRDDRGLDARRFADRLHTRVDSTHTLLTAAIVVELADVALAIGDHETARRLYLAAAAGCRVETIPTLIHALRQDVGCRLGEVSPDAAADAYRSIGHLRKAAEIQARSRPPEPKSARPSSPAPMPAGAAAQAGDAGESSDAVLTIAVDYGARARLIRYRRNFPPDSGPVAENRWLSPFVPSKGTHTPPAAIELFVKEWASAGREMSNLLHGAWRERSSQPGRVFLDTPVDLAGIPWELSPTADRHRHEPFPQIIRWMGPGAQSASNAAASAALHGAEKLLERLTRRARGDAQQQRHSRPRIILVNPKSMFRTDAGNAYTKLEGLLRRIDRNLVTLSEESLKGLENQPADIIFIISPLLDSPSLRSISLQTDRTPARSLGHMLSNARRVSAFGPVVVLDVPKSSTPLENVKQLFARNRFAHELMGTGNASAVFAVGLGGVDAELRLFETMCRALEEGYNVAQTFEAIREEPLSKPSPNVSDTLSSLPLAVALFTNDPSTPFGGA